MLLNDSTHKITSPLPPCILRTLSSSHLSSLYSLCLSQCHFYCLFSSCTRTSSHLSFLLSHLLLLLLARKWEATSLSTEFTVSPSPLLSSSSSLPWISCSISRARVSCNWKLEMTRGPHDGHGDASLSSSDKGKCKMTAIIFPAFSLSLSLSLVCVSDFLVTKMTDVWITSPVTSFTCREFVHWNDTMLSVCLSSFSLLFLCLSLACSTCLPVTRNTWDKSAGTNAFTMHLLIKLPLCLPLEQCIRQIYCMCTVARASRQARCDVKSTRLTERKRERERVSESGWK